jgi:hypothetical protein
VFESRAPGKWRGAVGEEAKVVNADKALGKDVQEEAAQELIEG